jgi:hypothetical protein
MRRLDISEWLLLAVLALLLAACLTGCAHKVTAPAYTAPALDSYFLGVDGDTITAWKRADGVEGMDAPRMMQRCVGTLCGAPVALRGHVISQAVYGGPAGQGKLFAIGGTIYTVVVNGKDVRIK